MALDCACVFPYESDVRRVCREQFYGCWCLDSSDVRLCIVRTMVGDNPYSRADYQSHNFRYHKPNNIDQNLVYQKAQTSVIEVNVCK